ncbi:MAG: AI-2E family transporter [Rhodospirillaceae bacterium]
MKTRNALAATGAAAVLLALIGKTVIVLIMIGIMLGIMLDSVAEAGQRLLGLNRRASVIMAAMLSVCLFAGLALLLAVPLFQQAALLSQSLFNGLAHLSETIRQDYPWLMQIIPLPDEHDQLAPQISKAGTAKAAVVSAATLVEWIADVIAIFFLGLFIAWDPRRSVHGVVGLWRKEARPRVLRLVMSIISAVRSYLFTLMVYIVAMAMMWTIGLWLIGLDYALVFGVLGGLAEIVPYIGPLIALIPPLLFSIPLGTATMLWVVLLYIILHIVEGYILVPYVLHRKEHLPAPLVVLSILVFGAIFGPLGVIVALPAGLICYVLVQELIYERREADGR